MKALSLSKKFPELQDPTPEGQQAIFDQGHRVGELAQQLFPGGVMAAFGLPEGFMQSMKYTRELIDQGQKIIYEAGFMFEKTHCFVDILVNDQNSWKIYEVKSSTEVKEINIYDAAFQYRILKNSGLDISDISIIHINNQYHRTGDLDVSQLFTIESIFEDVLKLDGEIEKLLHQEFEALEEDDVPDLDIGPHCFVPYQCNFAGHCWYHIPEYSVFDISRLRMDKKFDLYKSGNLNTTDIPDSYSLNTNQELQVQADKTGKSIINKRAINDFLQVLSYPLYFLDFETFNPGIPLYDHSRPYQQVVFQYSLHIMESPDSPLKHSEFLGIPQEDPRIPMVRQLLNELSNKGTILVYNKGFETGRLKEIAQDFPEFKSPIQHVLKRIEDLMTPFQQKHYYTPAMKGSYSIKHVLPALVPSFSYEDLEINNGENASLAFANLLYEKDPERINQVRNNLLAYCEMDTLAMVEILKILDSL